MMTHTESSAQPSTMDTAAFLKHIESAFRRIFSDDLNLMQYLPEDKWLALKQAGLLLPFLDKNTAAARAASLKSKKSCGLRGITVYPLPCVPASKARWYCSLCKNSATKRKSRKVWT